MPKDAKKGNEAFVKVLINLSDDPSTSISKVSPPNLTRNSFFSVRRSRFAEFIDPPPLESGDDNDTEDGLGSPGDSDVNSDGDDCPNGFVPSSKQWQQSILWTAIGLAFLAATTSFLFCTLIFPPLKHHIILGINLWRWALALLFIVCGYHISDWIVEAFLFLMRRARYMPISLHCVFYGFQVAMSRYIWVYLLCFAWAILTDRSKSTMYLSKAAHFCYRFLPAVFGSLLAWQAKTMLFEMFKFTFYSRLFYHQMKNSVFHLYMFKALMGTQLSEEKRKKLETMPGKSRSKKLSRMTAMAFSSSKLPRHVADKMLLAYIDGFKKSKFKADSQSKILKAAKRVFLRLANGHEYIGREDMLMFLTKKEVDVIFPFMEDTPGGGRIYEPSFLEWVSGAYRRQKALVHAITDTRIIVSNLHALASILIALMIFMISLVVVRVATTKVLVASFSQFLLLGFMFQNTARTIFESIIFVFVIHPFDVGDFCVVDGVQMIVEEMKILTTVFIRFDHEKIYYPNAQLLTKPISNQSRRTNMSEKIQFSIGVSTLEKDVDKLRKDVEVYLKAEARHWHANHSLLMKGVVETKMKMELNILHKIRYHDFPEMNKRKSELLFALKNMCVCLEIENYDIPKSII